MGEPKTVLGLCDVCAGTRKLLDGADCVCRDGTLAGLAVALRSEIERLKTQLQQNVKRLAYVNKTLTTALGTQDWDAVKAALYAQPLEVTDDDVAWARGQVEQMSRE